MGYRNPYSVPGIRTWVDEDNTKNIPPDAHKTKNPGNSGGGQSSPASKPDQRTQALPRTQNTDREIRRPAQPVHNAPGGSGSHPAGNLHEDRVRTKGKPGDQYKPQPIDQSRGLFKRRTLTSEERAASNLGKKPSGQARQREQKGTAKKKSHLWYLKNRKQVIRKQMLRYRRIRKKGLFKRDKMLRRLNPQWFARKKGGGYGSSVQRAQDYRKGKTRTKTKHKRKMQQKSKKKNRRKKATLNAFSFVVFYGVPVYMQGEGVCELRGINSSGFIVYRYKDSFRKISLHDFFTRATFFHASDLLELIETLDCLYLDDDEVEAMDKTAYSAQRKSWGRRKRKRGIARVKSKKYRMANRGRIKAKQRLYRQRLKRNPKFKRIQKLRRKMQKANPRRFRVRKAEVLTSNEIAFVAGAKLTLGFVRNISTMTGWVTYRLENGRVASMPLPAFWHSVVLLSEADVEAMFSLIEVEVGHEAFGLEMDYDQMRMCIELLEVDGNSEEFRELCMTETGVASISAMTADQLGSVASSLMNKVLVGGGRQITFKDEGDVFPRDDDDRDEQDHGKTPMFFGQVTFPEEDSEAMSNSMPARVAYRCADIGVYDKADLVRRETKPSEKSPTSLPDGSDEDAAYEGLPTWLGPSKLREERENQKPAEGFTVKRDMPGAPGSAKVIPRGTGFVGRTANRVIVAAKMAEILSGCSDVIHERANTLSIKRRRIDPRNAVWLYDVSGGEDTHRVRLKAVRNKNLRALNKADVLVSCDCNFWQWQGPEHWAKVGGYLYGKPRGTATKPNVKDPNGQHKACKHVVAVLGDMAAKNVSFRAKAPKRKRRIQGSSPSAGIVAKKYLGEV